MKYVLGNHLEDKLFHLVHWLKITLQLRRTNQECINLGKKVLPGLFFGYALYAGGILERWHTGCRPWGIGNEGRIANLLNKTQCERCDISQRKKENLLFQTQRDEKHFLEEIRNWEHPPWYGIDQFKEKVALISLENQNGLFHHLTLVSGCRWSKKWFLVHVKKLQKPPSRRTQNQAFLAERRIIPCSTEIHWRIQNYPYEFLNVKQEKRIDDYWNIDGQEICLMLGQVSLSLLF